MLEYRTDGTDAFDTLILGVRSSRSMIFMEDLWEGRDKSHNLSVIKNFSLHLHINQNLTI